MLLKNNNPLKFLFLIIYLIEGTRCTQYVLEIKVLPPITTKYPGTRWLLKYTSQIDQINQIHLPCADLLCYGRLPKKRGEKMMSTAGSQTQTSKQAGQAGMPNHL